MGQGNKQTQSLLIHNSTMEWESSGSGSWAGDSWGLLAMRSIHHCDWHIPCLNVIRLVHYSKGKTPLPTLKHQQKPESTGVSKRRNIMSNIVGPKEWLSKYLNPSSAKAFLNLGGIKLKCTFQCHFIYSPCCIATAYQVPNVFIVPKENLVPIMQSPMYQ